MKAYRALHIWTHPFLPSALDGGSDSLTPQPLFPWERNSCTHQMGGCVGPRAILDYIYIYVYARIHNPNHPSS